MSKKAFVWCYCGLACLLTGNLPLQAAQAKDFAGTWVLRCGTRNLYVLKLVSDGGGLTGTLMRPTDYSFTGQIFVHLSTEVLTEPIVSSHLDQDALHFIAKPVKGADNDQDAFVMHLTGNKAQLAIDIPSLKFVLEPYLFERGSPEMKVATDWEPNRAYVPGDSDTPSSAMKAIVDEDQRVRLATNIDWNAVNKSDPERREQTRKLLAEGALHTGKDYEEASLVFQHGASAQDFLLAHTLAMVAVTKGDATAIWIASATLDRYLQKIGQSQVFGTQSSSHNGGMMTQEPYDSNLISDALRRQLGVPPLILQQEQLNANRSQK